jgi:hypothetical protein
MPLTASELIEQRRALTVSYYQNNLYLQDPLEKLLNRPQNFIDSSTRTDAKVSQLLGLSLTEQFSTYRTTPLVSQYPFGLVLLQKNIFSYTGADQTFSVPSSFDSIVVQMWGAGGGGNGTARGGGGAYVEGTFQATPGENITVIVGSGGARFDITSCYGGGGGSGSVRGAGGQGGGRSALRRGTTEFATAGAGGGGGAQDGPWGGGAATVDNQSFAGDVTIGTQIQSNGTQSSGSGGGGSSTAGGGQGQFPHGRGPAGQFQGGPGGSDTGSGGGGGGYWAGGGGGYNGGGGGGGSYLLGLTNTDNSRSALREVAGNTSSPLRGTAGTGGNNGKGGDGLVIMNVYKNTQKPSFAAL